MANFEDDATYNELMKDVPHAARVAIDQLRQITNAQTDFIACLLVHLQRHQVFADQEIRQMIDRWKFEFRNASDEHGPLADSVVHFYDAQQHLLGY